MGHRYSSPRNRGASPSRRSPNRGYEYAVQPQQNIAFQPRTQTNTKDFMIPNAISQNVSRMGTIQPQETGRIIKTEHLNEEEKAPEGDFHKVNAAVRFAGTFLTMTAEENATISIHGRPEVGLNVQTFFQDVGNSRMRRIDPDLESDFIQIVQIYNHAERLAPLDQVVGEFSSQRRLRNSHPRSEKNLENSYPSLSRRETEHSETRSTGGRSEIQLEKRVFGNSSGHSNIYQQERNARKAGYQMNDSNPKVLESSRGKHSEAYGKLHQDPEPQEKPKPIPQTKPSSNKYFGFSKQISEASKSAIRKEYSNNERKSSRTSLHHSDEDGFEPKMLNSKTQETKKTTSAPQNKILRQAEASAREKNDSYTEDRKENLKQMEKSRGKTPPPPSRTDELKHSEKNRKEDSKKSTPAMIHKQKSEENRNKNSRDSSIERSKGGNSLSQNIQQKELKTKNKPTESKVANKLTPIQTKNNMDKPRKSSIPEKNPKKENNIVAPHLKYQGNNQQINLYELNESQIPVRSDIEADDTSDDSDDLQPVQATLDLSNFIGNGKAGKTNQQRNGAQEKASGMVPKGGRNVSDKAGPEMKRIPLVNQTPQRENNKINSSRNERPDSFENNQSKSARPNQPSKTKPAQQWNDMDDEQQFLNKLRDKFNKLDLKTDKMMSITNQRSDQQSSRSTTNGRNKSPIGNKVTGVQSKKVEPIKMWK